MLLIGAAAVGLYLVPRLVSRRAPWPMWDISVYWWGGRQVLHGATIYAAHEPRSFTYPPFAAAAFATSGAAPEVVLKISLMTLSLAGLIAIDLLSRTTASGGKGLPPASRRALS